MKAAVAFALIVLGGLFIADSNAAVLNSEEFAEELQKIINRMRLDNRRIRAPENT